MFEAFIITSGDWFYGGAGRKWSKTPTDVKLYKSKGRAEHVIESHQGVPCPQWKRCEIHRIELNNPTCVGIYQDGKSI